MMDIVLLDFGVGNLHSLAKAVGRHGARVRLVTDPVAATETDILVLPGVGAFGPAAAALAPGRDHIRGALREGLPCIGICLGMQLLFEESEESTGPGLGVIPGCVRRLEASRVPHMGWNSVETGTDLLFRGVGDLIAYYAHSYVVAPARDDDVIAWTRYDEQRFPAAVRHGRTWGVQFHPEKSAAAGLRLLDNFLELARS